MFSFKRHVKKDNNSNEKSSKNDSAKLSLTPTEQKSQQVQPSPARPRRKVLKEEEKSGVSPIYVYSFKLVGNRIKFMFPRLRIIDRRLERAMLPVPYEAYVSAMVFLSLIGGTVGLGIGLFISLSVNIQPAEFGVLLPFIAGSAGSQVTFMMMYFYPSMSISSRRKMLAEEMPYFLGYMATLASSGLTVERIFRALAREDTKEAIIQDAKYLTRNVEVLGMDIITALIDLARKSPSQPYTELLEGLISTIQSGGILKEYFIATARVQLEEKKLLLRKMTASLGIIAEMYTILLVVFPLLSTIMLSIMAIMTPQLGGFNLVTLMTLLTYIFVPIVGVMMLIMIDAMIPKR